MGRRKSNDIKIKDIIIAVVAVIIIIAIALFILRFVFPDQWNSLFGKDKNAENNNYLVAGDGDLAVHFFDVGQGDSIYIEFPDGDDMLIDCGSTNGCTESKALGYIQQLDDDGVINHLMLTHTDQDHVEFLDAVVDAYQIENIYMPNVLSKPKGTSARATALKNAIDNLPEEKLAMFTDKDVVETLTYASFFAAALSEPDCNIYLNVDDDENTNNIVISDDENTYRLTFYCPTRDYYDKTNLGSAEKLNAVSPVGILEYNGKRIVLTGDSNEINEPTVAQRIGVLDCDVLKVAHHGSETSSTAQFLAAVKCEYAVISCGEGNGYQHPRQAALDRIAVYNMTVYRTDKNGDILLVISASGQLSFTVEKESSQQDNYRGADA